MMTAWILVTWVSYYSGIKYSQPVATKESCEAIKAETEKLIRSYRGISTCVKVEMHK
jgi:hypothetical protein